MSRRTAGYFSLTVSKTSRATRGRCGISPSQWWNGIAVWPPMTCVFFRVPPWAEVAPSVTVQTGASQLSYLLLNERVAETRDAADGALGFGWALGALAAAGAGAGACGA